MLSELLSNPNFKEGIYQAVKAVNQKLQLTEGQSKEFTLSSDEMSKFKGII